MKKSFNTILIAAITVFSVFITLSNSSCNRDKCKTIVCANGGVCSGGICTCPTGYEGTNCETVSRDKFTGNYQVIEKGSITESAQYGTVIAADPDPNKISYVQILGFWNYFTNVQIEAYVNGDTITIPNQNIQGHVVVGYGYFFYSTTYSQYGNINLYYKVIDTATNQVFDYGFYSTDHTKPSLWEKH